MTTTAALVSDYTARFAAGHLDEHSVGSGLGIWVLLALLAPAVEGDERARLEAVLGTSVEDAARRAAALLADPHPAVHAAVALWERSEAVIDAFRRWAGALPPTLERGPMPDQEEANRWADRNTLGMIPTFPLLIDDDTLIVLASALATDVSWTWPFETTPSQELGGPLAAGTTTALRAHRAHVQLIVDTDAVGLVAAHSAEATAGLRVVSVIGPPDATPALVHRAALQVAALLDGEGVEARPVDLFDLPLGDGHSWSITDEEVIRSDGPDRVQTVSSVIPAWTASSNHDLAAAPGIAEVVDTFLDLAGDARVFEARQAAFAEYTRRGFRAAALTAMAATRTSFRGELRVTHRRAEVRFSRPYAVVAIAVDQQREEWAGVPVFSAWVERAVDAPEGDDDDD